MWIGKAEYRRLLKQLARAERRYDTVLSALAEEREANRLAERWWANALLRAKQAYPLPDKPDQATTVAVPASSSPQLEPMDQGEYEALLAAGHEYGVGKSDVDRLLRIERGEEL